MKVAPATSASAALTKRVFSEEQVKSIYELSLWDQRRWTLGVFMILTNAIVAARWPEHYWILYLMQGIILVPLRFLRFRRKNEELLLLDFCYVVSLFALLWTILALARFGSSAGSESALTRFDKSALRAGFSYSCGALAWSVVIFKNAAIFHSVDHLTSLFIHLSPALHFYCLRWGSGMGPGASQAAWPGLFRVCHLDTEDDDSLDSEPAATYDSADACTLHAWCDEGCPASFFDMVLMPALIYCGWALPSFIFLFVAPPRCIEARGKETLFSFIVQDKDMSRSLICVPEKPRILRPLAYQAQHFATICIFSCSTLVLWHSFWVHTLMIVYLAFVAVSNSSAYMFRHFSVRYAEQKLCLAHPDTIEVKSGSNASDTAAGEVAEGGETGGIQQPEPGGTKIP